MRNMSTLFFFEIGSKIGISFTNVITETKDENRRQTNHTIELRGFNSELHAGKTRAYIVFALAMNHQALTQKSASYRKVQEENEKFAMRVYLNRIGFIGEEFKSCRQHLYEHLDGNAAWRYGSKENCRNRRKKPKSETQEEML